MFVAVIFKMLFVTLLATFIAFVAARIQENDYLLEDLYQRQASTLSLTSQPMEVTPDEKHISWWSAYDIKPSFEDSNIILTFSRWTNTQVLAA